MKEKQISVDVDGNVVWGDLHLPDDADIPATLVTFVPGWAEDRTNELYERAAERFAENGYAVCRFDPRGYGESDMSFKKQTLTTIVEDIGAVTREMGKREDITDLDDATYVGGHSMGGTASLIYAANGGEADRVFGWMSTTYSYPEALPQQVVDTIKDQGYVDWGDELFYKEYYDDFEERDMEEILGQVDIPVLGIYGDNDSKVLPIQAGRLERLVPEPVHVELVEDLDHYATGEGNQDRLINSTLEWLD